MLTYISSAKTAHGDTVKTLIDTMTLPKDCKRILGIACYADGTATLTTGEPLSGICELESDDMPITPCQVPIKRINVLTSGAEGGDLKHYPCDIPTKGGERIKVYVTLDVAQTGAQTARANLAIER